MPIDFGKFQLFIEQIRDHLSKVFDQVLHFELNFAKPVVVIPSSSLLVLLFCNQPICPV